jgi:hypothetical protein
LVGILLCNLHAYFLEVSMKALHDLAAIIVVVAFVVWMAWWFVVLVGAAL